LELFGPRVDSDTAMEHMDVVINEASDNEEIQHVDNEASDNEEIQHVHL
jgi:hypothetical protein